MAQAAFLMSRSLANRGGGNNTPSAFCSLKESFSLHSRGAVDVDHEGGKSGRTVHHVLLNRGQVLVDVGLVGVSTLNEI